MAKKRMPWFRFYVEAPSDRKVRRMKPEHRWIWVCVLCAARTSPTPGELWVAPGDPMTVDDLADLAGVPPKMAATAMAHMIRLGMVAGQEPWTVPAWGDRQYESDTSTERVKKHRAKQTGNAGGTADETFHNRSSNGPETETETDVTTPLPPLVVPSVGDNRSASHGHYPYDERPATHPAVAQLHTTLAAFPGTGGAS
jgi:hypothetical protein